MTGRRLPPPAAAQFYPLRQSLREDLETTVKQIAELGFHGVEPSLALSPDLVSIDAQKALGEAMPPMFDAATLRPALDRHGLVAFAAHGPLPEGEHATWVLDQAEALGVECIIVAAWMALGEGADRAHEDRDALTKVIERFDAAAEAASARGLSIGFHNHFWEWQQNLGGGTAWDLFWQEVDPRVRAEVDVYWAHAAGRDPAKIVDALGERVHYLHLKDGPGTLDGAHTALGEGVVDLGAVIAAARKARWHVVELDRCETDMLEAMGKSRAWLTERGYSS